MQDHKSPASSSAGSLHAPAAASDPDLSAGESSRPPSPSHLAAPKMAALGLHAAPPDLVPPSPAVTESAQDHTREGTEAEEDITNTNVSWSELDDSDTSKDSSKGVPSADHALQQAFGGGGAAASTPQPPRHTPEHPLRLEGEAPAPSPPLWERIDPPPTNGQRDGYSSTNTRVVHEFTSKLSRPLIPHSSYYCGPPPTNAAFGTEPVGQLGVHHPREIVRVERDYTGGDLVQFAAVYPLELEGRITPTQFLETINAINELLISAHSLSRSFFDNALSFLTLQLSRAVLTSHYDKEMQRLHKLIDELNVELYNPVGLNILWPHQVAFLFLEIEYYTQL